VHVGFSRDAQSGFEGLRRVFQAAQGRHMPRVADIAQIAREAPWFARAVFWRMFEKRVFPPSGSQFELHLVTEQEPRPAQSIDLSPTQVDPFGLPRARIDWTVSESDIESFARVAALTFERWKDSPIGRIARLTPRARNEVHTALKTCGGIYHPAGTTRIGPDSGTGVVDTDLQVHGVPGLRALATSVFPSVGGSSPSLALVQLALRMAQQIADRGPAGRP
jgi:choline dehydrogenase-like flavoprotein